LILLANGAALIGGAGCGGREASHATRDNRFSDRLAPANQQAGNYQAGARDLPVTTYFIRQRVDEAVA